jgi:O-antigen ligase
MYKIITSLSFNEILIIFFPIFLITGPFLTDFVGTYLGLYFLVYCLVKRDLKEYKNFFFIYFIIIYIYLNLNSIWSFSPEISFQTTLPYLRTILFIFGLSFFLKKNLNLYKLFYLVSIFCLLFLLFDSLVQYLFNHNIFNDHKINITRISSLFGDELIMGSYVSRLLPVIIGLSFIINLKKRENINLITLIIGGLLVILSGERTSFFYYLILIFFYFFLFKKKIIYFSLISILSISLMLNINDSQIDRLFKYTKNQIAQTSSVYSYRHELHFLTALNLFYDNKFFGQGIKSFRNLCGQDKYVQSIKKKITLDLEKTSPNDNNYAIISEFPNGCNTHPHNIYLEFLSELGVVGFGLFITIFCYVFFKLFYFLKLFFMKKKLQNHQYASAFMLLAVFSSMFPFITSGSYFNNWIIFISYIPIAFYLSFIKFYND